MTVAREILLRAEEGDDQARTVVEEEGRTIGEAIATVCAVVDPDWSSSAAPSAATPPCSNPSARR
ncbi:hypothetical protein ACWD26_16440 [Streptomyces sp. NPDC002787]